MAVKKRSVAKWRWHCFNIFIIMNSSKNPIIAVEIGDLISHDEYVEFAKALVLRAHKHSDNSKIELKVTRDPDAVEAELIFAKDEQDKRIAELKKAQDSLAKESGRRFHRPAASSSIKYEGNVRLIHNSKIVFTCNCGKSFAFGGRHEDDFEVRSKDFSMSSYENDKEGRFSMLNEYGVLVDAPSDVAAFVIDYEKGLPSANFKTGYDKNEED